jgi:hypothetical protein
LYFSSHEAEAITPQLRQLFATADTVLIEQSFSEEDNLNLNLLNELSQGNLLPEDLRKISSGIGVQPHPEFNRELNSMIFQSRKPIELERPPVDVNDAVAYDKLTRQEFQNMPVGKACRLLADNLAKRAAYEKKRDEALAEQLKALASTNPTASILVIRGHGHQRSLENALTARGISARSVTSHETMLSLFTDELMQKLIAERRPSRRELLKSLVEQAETRTTSFQPTQANIRAVGDRVGGMSEIQCEKYLRKKLNLM